MGLIRLRSFLQRHKRVALDTSVFIYQLEANPRYISLTEVIFDWLARPGNVGVTSTITMMELLVHPYQDEDSHTIDEYYSLLATYPNLTWIAPGFEVADIAARIRATHRLRTPDALQAAAAVYSQVTALVTNDPVFERLNVFETILLDRLIV